jgi:hypothetical protein
VSSPTKGRRGDESRIHLDGRLCLASVERGKTERRRSTPNDRRVYVDDTRSQFPGGGEDAGQHLMVGSSLIVQNLLMATRGGQLRW